MSTLKKLFPYSFGADSVASLVIKIIVYVCLPTILWIATSLINLVVGGIPLVGAIVGWVLGVISSLISLYVVVGIVLLVLDYLKVLKD